MALVKYGIAVAQLSGTIGGNVFARNSGGNYVRKWSTVATTPTAKQVNVRALFASANAAFAALNPAQRQAWNDVALTKTVKNRLGEDIKLSGQSTFIASSMAIMAANRFTAIDIPMLGNAPADLLSPNPPKQPTSLVIDASDGTIELYSPDAVVPAGQAFLIDATAGKQPSLVPQQSEFRAIATRKATEAIDGNDFITEWSAIFGALTAGTEITFRLRSLDISNGLMSTPVEISALVAV